MESYQNTRLIVNYINGHPKVFSSSEKEMILNYLVSGDYMFGMPDVVREIYDELGLLPDERNIYKAFMNLTDEQFPIRDRNIVEIGGGIIPTLAKRIAEVQDKGRIVVYDPKLSEFEQETDKLKLVRRKFESNTSLGDANLLIGLMPCEAANIIVEVAVKNRVDFMLGLCEGGIHGDEFDFYADEEEWRSSLMLWAARQVEEKNMGKLKVKSLKEYGDPYPIIYNDRG